MVHTPNLILHSFVKKDWGWKQNTAEGLEQRNKRQKGSNNRQRNLRKDKMAFVAPTTPDSLGVFFLAVLSVFPTLRWVLGNFTVYWVFLPNLIPKCPEDLQKTTMKIKVQGRKNKKKMWEHTRKASLWVFHLKLRKRTMIMIKWSHSKGVFSQKRRINEWGEQKKQAKWPWFSNWSLLIFFHLLDSGKSHSPKCLTLEPTLNDISGLTKMSLKHKGGGDWLPWKKCYLL